MNYSAPGELITAATVSVIAAVLLAFGAELSVAAPANAPAVESVDRLTPVDASDTAVAPLRATDNPPDLPGGRLAPATPPGNPAPILASLRWTPWVVLTTWLLIGAGIAAAVRGAGRAAADPHKDAENARTNSRPASAGLDLLDGDALREVHSTAVRAAADAIVIADQTGRISWVNPAFTSMTGYDAADARGQELGFLTAQPTDVVLHHDLWETIRNGEVWRGEAVNCRKNGTRYTEEQTITPVADPHGEISYFIAIKRDITARKRAEADLERARKDADVANRAKSDFLAVVSHEVRTPLNGIIGMTELALQTRLDDQQRDYLDMIKTSADSLLTVINDLLDVSKMEAGKLRLDPTAFTLHECVATALSPLVVRAQRKGLALRVAVAADVPDGLIGDPGRLGQILVNLAGNAIKFTEHGEVVLNVTTVDARGARPDVHDLQGVPAAQTPRQPAGVTPRTAHIVLHFALRDTGIGIPPETQARIFQSFEQGDVSTTRRFGGTGLGLAISKSLAEMMGGEMWLESEAGAGSTFHFTTRLGVQPYNTQIGVVPTLTAVMQERPALDDTHAPANDTGPGRAALPERPRLHVLLAEDNPINQRIVVCLLEERGHSVVVTHTGHEALRALSTQSFDVVVMDVQMPDMDGLQATAEIRQREARHTSPSGLTGRRIPIIAMTAHAMPGYRERCLTAGMDGYVTKPFDPTELYEAVETAAAPVEHTGGRSGPVRESGDGHAASIRGTQMGAAPAVAAVIDRGVLAERLDGNVQLLREVLELFARQTPLILSRIRAALSRGDAPQLELDAHSIKGALANLSADPAAEIAERLERVAHSGDLTEAAATYTVLEQEITRVQQALEQLAQSSAPFVSDAIATAA